MKKNVLRRLLIVIGIPLGYCLIVMGIFGFDDWEDFFGVMSVTFVFLLPMIAGFLTVNLSSKEKASRLGYRVFMPWVPILIFFVLTVIFSLEGFACWIMILPFFLGAASIGGIIGGWLKSGSGTHTLRVSFIAFLPFLVAPIENLLNRIPGTYEAYTSIDIQAPAERIWENVTRVSEIPPEQDKGWLTRFLGFPRPVKAELDFEGVGAYREAIFTNGLVFHETVTEYRHQEKMVFNIKAYPHEIPSATLDEHVVIGGEFFDVLNGTYELERLRENSYRLHLYSRFVLKTNFNFYASWWAKWIMKDIQNNILQIEKTRAEKG